MLTPTVISIMAVPPLDLFLDGAQGMIPHDVVHESWKQQPDTPCRCQKLDCSRKSSGKGTRCIRSGNLRIELLSWRSVCVCPSKDRSIAPPALPVHQGSRPMKGKSESSEEKVCSSRSPLVAVMEPSDFGELDHGTKFRRLNRARFGRSPNSRPDACAPPDNTRSKNSEGHAENTR